MQQFVLRIELAISQFRKGIPADSQTARAIDRNDSWRRLVEIARAEGYAAFCQDIEKAMDAIEAARF